MDNETSGNKNTISKILFPTSYMARTFQGQGMKLRQQTFGPCA